jgi:hypothetical protein
MIVELPQAPGAIEVRARAMPLAEVLPAPTVSKRAKVMGGRLRAVADHL